MGAEDTGSAPGGPGGIPVRGQGPAQVYRESNRSDIREAATVLLVRDGDDGRLEVLLVRRNPESRVMPGTWVFPGGGVEPEDGDDDQTAARAATRELREETGVEGIDPADLVAISRWITPQGAPRRFDTRFFVAPAPDGADPQVDGVECVEARWFRPSDALDGWREKALLVVLPTVKHLEQLEPLADVAALLAHVRGREVPVVRPRFIVEDGDARVVLPGDAEYDDARG